MHRILVGNPERTRLHGRPRSIREIILKWVVNKSDWMVVWVRLVQDSVRGLLSCDCNAKTFLFHKMRETASLWAKILLSSEGQCSMVFVRLPDRSCSFIVSPCAAFRLSSLPIVNNKTSLCLFKSNIGRRNHSRRRAFWSVTSISARNNLKSRCQSHLRS